MAMLGEHTVKSTVLLVDDDPMDLKILAALVASWGHDVVACTSGAEALRCIEEGPVDLVLSDVRMPGMSGQELVGEVGRACPGLPVLLITGHGEVKSAVAAMKIGAHDYVLKPPDEDELHMSLERALEHSRLRRENRFLRAQLAAGGAHGERMIGRSAVMVELFEMIDRVAGTDSTVLITGETGTGKELVAQAIHFRSSRAAGPFLALNCAALNANIIESELFGHEKGAFTGAIAARRGRFEEADGGTLFLDEIGETSTDFQAKLLRVLQEGEFERVGGNAGVRSDARVLASTNRDLEAGIRSGTFREDLFYRLSVIPIRVPPLRERRDDIPFLVAHFVAMYGERYHGTANAVSQAGLDALAGRAWPGNVRELQHAVERAVVLSPREVLEPMDFAVPDGAAGVTDDGDTLQAVLDRKTREHLLAALEATGWRKGRAARELGIDRTTLYRLLRKFRIAREAETD